MTDPNIFRLGVIGYSAGQFDRERARLLLNAGFDFFQNHAIDHSQFARFPVTELVSGLTNVGIPALAYEIAASPDRRWKTAGVACSKAEEYDCFPVDRRQIVGTEWGDESETFLAQLDGLLRVGGGPQSAQEFARAAELGIPCLYLPLDRDDA